MSGRRSLKLANFVVRQFERRRTDDLCARAERGLVRGFDSQARHVADDRDAQSAGGAARSENDFAFENRQILRRSVKDRMALMQAGERRQQTFAHVGADRRRRLASADQSRGIEIDRNHLVKVLPKSMRRAREDILRQKEKVQRKNAEKD